MKLLGHQSMATSQRYVTIITAGLDARPAAARNPVYRAHTRRPTSEFKINIIGARLLRLLAE